MVDRGVDGFQFPRAVLDLAIGGDVFHRAGTVKRHQRHDVLDAGGAHPAQRVHHPRGFHLEHRDRAGAGEQAIGGFVVQRDQVDFVNGTGGRIIELPAVGGDMQMPAAGADQVHGVLDHRQGFQAQKVELDQPRLFHPFHVVLRGRHVRAGVAVQRHQPVQRPVPDHHPGGVGRGIAQQPLDLGGVIQHPAHVFLGRGGLAQAGFVSQRLGDRDRLDALDRDHLGQAVALGKAHAQHPAHVMHRRLGQQRAKGDDLAHLVTAVFVLDVADDLFAPVHAEVDVEVRHRHPFRVQEAFEQQRIAQRVKVGDGQRIGHQRPRARAAPRPDRDPLPLGPFDEVGDDQEIAGKAHLLDDAQLEIQPCVIILDGDGVGDDGQTRVQPLARLAAQFLDLVIGETGQDRVVAGDGKGAAAGDFHGVGDGLGQVGEQHRHVLGRLEIMVGGQAAARGRLVHHRAFADADQRVMGAEHRGIGEIRVIGGDQRQVQRIGKVDHAAFTGGFGRHQLAVVLQMALQFHIQPVAENPRQIAQMRFGVRQLAPRHQLPQRPGRAAGQADQPGRMPGQFLHGHMREIARRRDVKTGGQRHQVHPAVLILRQQHHRPASRARVQRDLAADDGLHTLVQRLDGKLQRREQGVGVGQRDRGHPVFRGQSRQFLDGNRPFEQRMLGMAAQVDESGRFGHGANLAPGYGLREVARTLSLRYPAAAIWAEPAKTV